MKWASDRRLVTQCDKLVVVVSNLFLVYLFLVLGGRPSSDLERAHLLHWLFYCNLSHTFEYDSFLLHKSHFLFKPISPPKYITQAAERYRITRPLSAKMLLTFTMSSDAHLIFYVIFNFSGNEIYLFY